MSQPSASESGCPAIPVGTNIVQPSTSEVFPAIPASRGFVQGHLEQLWAETGYVHDQLTVAENTQEVVVPPTFGTERSQVLIGKNPQGVPFDDEWRLTIYGGKVMHYVREEPQGDEVPGQVRTGESRFQSLVLTQNFDTLGDDTEPTDETPILTAFEAIGPYGGQEGTPRLIYVSTGVVFGGVLSAQPPQEARNTGDFLDAARMHRAYLHTISDQIADDLPFMPAEEALRTEPPAPVSMYPDDRPQDWQGYAAGSGTPEA